MKIKLLIIFVRRDAYQPMGRMEIKMIKKTVLIFCFLILFSFSAAAETADFYEQQYKLSGADELEDALPEKAEEFMRENEILPDSGNLSETITAQNVFSHIWGFIKSGAKTPFISGVSVLGVIFISAAVEGWGASVSAEAVKYATVISAVSVIAAPVSAVITAGVSAMKGCAVFMTAFIPVFAAVCTAAGNAVTSASMSALLLGAAQGVSFIANFIVIPLMGGYLAITVASSVSPVISNSGIADGIKKLSFWIMSLTSTLFIGIISIQTALGASADGLSVRTAKFIIGSAVPVAGPALSEALTTVTAAIGTLKASVGIYGVIACAVIFLPILAELFLWRLVLAVTDAVSSLFSLGKISSVLKGVDAVMSVLIGIILLILAVFIISLTIVVGAAK